MSFKCIFCNETFQTKEARKEHLSSNCIDETIKSLIEIAEEDKYVFKEYYESLEESIEVLDNFREKDYSNLSKENLMTLLRYQKQLNNINKEANKIVQECETYEHVNEDDISD